MNKVLKNSFLGISSIFILVYFTACANPNINSSNKTSNISKKIPKKITEKTSEKTLYSELLEYKGKQSKKEIILLNKKPISVKNINKKHMYPNTRISKDGKTVIMGATAYSLYPFKSLFTASGEGLIALDFYDNHHVFFADKNNYGLYNFKTKKYAWKYKMDDNYEDMSYSNGILKYKWSRKTGRITWTLYTTYFKLNPKNKGTRLRHLGNKYTKGIDIIVNDNQTYSLEIWDVDKISLVNLKNNSRKNISNKVKRCIYEVTNFITNNSFQCGGTAYKIPSLEEIPYPNRGISSRIITPSRVLTKKDDQLLLRNFKTERTINSIKLNENPFNSLYRSNTLITNPKGYDFNIYDISKFLGNKKAKLFSKVWLEVNKIKNKDPKIDELFAIEKALNFAYKYSIKLDTSKFVTKGNTVEVELDQLGKFTFKAKDIIKSLSNKYYLKNTKFKIQNNNIKLISADLEPAYSGYILSYGRVPPSYKRSPHNPITKYKLNQKEKNSLKRANKMYRAGLKDESTLIINSLLEKNPIGVELETRDNTFPFSTYSNITSKTINELKKHKLYFLNINMTDTKNMLDKGAVVKRLFSKNLNLNVGDVILSIDSYQVSREQDVREIIKNVEDPKNIEIEILRNNIKMNINTEANNIAEYSVKLFTTYLDYIKNAVKSRNPNIAREAYLQLEQNIELIPLTKNRKEKLLLIDSLTLAAQGQSDKAIKKLFKYEDKFEKSSIDFLVKSDSTTWGPLLEQKEKLAILFDIPSSKIKSPKIGKQYDYYDINGNLVISTKLEKVIKKKIEPKLQIQQKPSFQKGGVLE